jgi:phosphate starvation-inducible membrane PsiE
VNRGNLLPTSTRHDWGGDAAPWVDCHGMARDPQRVFFRILEAFESIAYLTIAFGLSVPVVMLVIFAVRNMLEVAQDGILDTALDVLDGLLLAFIFVELINTIRIATGLGERGIFIAEPFLLVGLVAVVRGILLLTADLHQVQSMEEVQILLMEVGILAILLGVLTIALYYARRMGLSEQKREISK